MSVSVSPDRVTVVTPGRSTSTPQADAAGRLRAPHAGRRQGRRYRQHPAAGWTTYFAMDSADEVSLRLQECGGTVAVGPAAGGAGRAAAFYRAVLGRQPSPRPNGSADLLVDGEPVTGIRCGTAPGRPHSQVQLRRHRRRPDRTPGRRAGRAGPRRPGGDPVRPGGPTRRSAGRAVLRRRGGLTQARPLTVLTRSRGPAFRGGRGSDWSARRGSPGPGQGGRRRS